MWYMRTILALLTTTLAMPAIAGCELSTNVVNCTALALFPEDSVKPQPPDTVDVHAKAETEPVTNPCDAADDPAIWSHPDIPENSRIVVSNKTGKLAVHGLDGRTLSEIRVGRINNVDIRGGVTMAAGSGWWSRPRTGRRRPSTSSSSTGTTR